MIRCRTQPDNNVLPVLPVPTQVSASSVSVVSFWIQPEEPYPTACACLSCSGILRSGNVKECTREKRQRVQAVIDSSGVCPVCGDQLDHFNLTAEGNRWVHTRKNVYYR